MYIEKKVVVEEILYEDEEVQILKTSDYAKKALLYVQITPKANINDEVIVNTTATILKLGTGGMDIVTSVLGSSPLNREAFDGHIMKARYLPSQHSVLAVEAKESKFHHLFQQSFSLDGKKILIGELHSMIPICFWAMDLLKENGKMVTIISDEGSIPLSISQHIRVLKNYERFSTITIGQAFGGTYEAINLQTALQFAYKQLNADVILVTLGPGVVGSGTYFGFSGIEQASWANVIGSLDGVPVWVPRLSQADKRERHQGISHHTYTALTKFTYVKSMLPMPVTSETVGDKINEQIKDIEKQHDVHWLERAALEEIVEHCLHKSPVRLQTMGRDYRDDPIFFLGVAAAIKWLIEYD